MKKIIFPVLISLALFTLTSCSEPPTGNAPDMISILWDDARLAGAKDAIGREDPAIIPAFTEFRRMVDSLYLPMEPLSVTMKKTLPPSRDPRDFMTLSPYWWPNPETADGLPYIRRDGERNPEVYNFPERVNSSLTGDAAQVLALMYYLTDDEKYADKAAQIIRVWFLDPVTGMNPNMTYAQHVPGMKSLRGTGIIDTRRYLVALNAAKVIEGSDAWSAEDKRALSEWAGALGYWLAHSTQGLKELGAGNNHGLWYDALRLIAATYAEDYQYALEIVSDSFVSRIAVQVAGDGSLPRELERTLGLHYSTFALEAASVVDIIGRKLGTGIWTQDAPNGRNLRQAIDYLLPYYAEPETWPHQQIKPFEQERAAILLQDAGAATGNQEYVELARRIGYTSATPDINSVLYFDLRR